MGLPHPLSDPLIELIAQRLRVVGEPMRIKLLDQLRDGDATVQELADRVGAVRQNVSKHLERLHQAGVVERRKVGNHVSYALADPAALELLETAAKSLAHQLAELAEHLDADDSEDRLPRSGAADTATRGPRARAPGEG